MLSELSSIKPDAKLDCSANSCPLEGTNDGNGENAQDELRFVSLNAAQAFAGSQGNFGLTEVSYRLEKPERDSPFYEENEDELKVLIREEIPADLNNKKILEKKQISTPLAHNLTFLNFRYYNNFRNEWGNKWELRNSKPPGAIEITLGLKGENGREETFRTAVFTYKQ